MGSAFIQAAGSLPRIVKDPDAELDYVIAFGNWLNGDTLASVEWEIDSGLTGANESINTGASVTIDGVVHAASTVATIWLSGGSVGNSYRVRARATTAAGRIDDRSFYVYIAEK